MKTYRKIYNILNIITVVSYLLMKTVPAISVDSITLIIFAKEIITVKPVDFQV